MAWITDAQLRTAVAAALGLTGPVDLGSHLTPVCAWANPFAYKKIRAVLMGRGFTSSQLDSWEGNTEWNERLGVLYAVLRASKRGEGYDAAGVEQEIKDALEELAAETIVISGEAVYPEGTASRVSYGDETTSADRFLLDEPDGSGDFGIADGTTL